MKTFAAKILLFGEYGLLKGAMGLALPYSNYSGKLVLPVNELDYSKNQHESNLTIKKLALQVAQYNSIGSSAQFQLFFEEALLGLHFQSIIPNSYGIGSSGALVAAVYDRYFANDANKKPKDLIQIKTELSNIESYFHGQSSGIDPLVSLLNKPILLNASVNNYTLKNPQSIKIFLIDTQKPSSTKNFIQLFETKASNQHNLVLTLIDKSNKALISFLNDESDVFSTIKDFCDFENQFLSEMFVDNAGLKRIKAVYQNNLAIKLCGSGGGGFLLGFAKTESYENLSVDFLKQKIRIEEVKIPTSQLISI